MLKKPEKAKKKSVFLAKWQKKVEGGRQLSDYVRYRYIYMQGTLPL